MGSLLTLHLAGGPGGMRGILDHAGEAIEDWWTPPAKPAHLTPRSGPACRSGRRCLEGRRARWVTWRDRILVELLKLQAASAEHRTCVGRRGRS